MKQVTGPINLLACPVLETAGTPVKAETEFIFRRTGAGRKSQCLFGKS